MRALFAFLAAGLVVAGAVFLAEHPGAITIIWQGWEIRTSLAAGLLVLFLIVVLLVSLFSLSKRLLTAPGRFTGRRRNRALIAGHYAISQGLVALAGGDHKEAMHHHAKSLRHFNRSAAPVPGLTRLIAAQAATLDGDDAKAYREFSAMLDDKELAFLGLRGLIVQALKKGDDKAALALTERAKQLRPGSAWVLQAELTLRSRLGDWREATSTLRAAVKLGAVAADSGRHYRTALMIARSEEALRDDRRRDALTFAKEAYKLEPDFPPALVTYAKMLDVQGRRTKGLTLLERAWATHPHPAIARGYEALWQNETPTERYRQLRKLTLAQPSPEAYLVSGQAALAAKLWGDARQNLDRAGAESTGPWSVGLCQAMIALEQNDGGNAQSIALWQSRLAAAPAEDSWHCSVCGQSSEFWSPTCPHCSSLGSLLWQSPLDEPGKTSTPAMKTNAALIASIGDTTGAGALGTEPSSTPAIGKFARLRQRFS